ncbi:MAG: hypothetical protein Ta2A_03970 [Treponemataceae bacterium]|nr:MAG: hypothetical protein Ta2A_03970 [Treponemataceae bacterium]
MYSIGILLRQVKMQATHSPDDTIVCYLREKVKAASIAASMPPRVCYANSATGCGAASLPRWRVVLAGRGYAAGFGLAQRVVPGCTQRYASVQFSAHAGVAVLRKIE